jgi:hypothetical protein
VEAKIMKIRFRLHALAELRATSLLALWSTLGLGMMTWPNEALGWTGQPLVYVSSNDEAIAITPGGKHVYVPYLSNDDTSGTSGPAGEYGAVERWSGGAVERWSGGVVEWWSGGVVEWSSGRVMEWWS